MNRGLERVAAAMFLAALLASVVVVAGCAGRSPDVTGSDSATRTGSVTATLSPAGEEPTRMPAHGTYGRAVDYDESFTRVKDMTSVRKTYGIDVGFPAEAAGGKIAGLWMTPPDVDGGNAWALYDTSLVEIHIWIAPTLTEANAGRVADGPGPTISSEVNGHKAITVPRVWVPARRVPAPGSRTGRCAPAHWSAAEVRWAQGLCVVTVSSTERDVEDLLGVARAVEITGTARMPMPKKFKKK